MNVISQFRTESFKNVALSRYRDFQKASHLKKKKNKTLHVLKPMAIDYQMAMGLEPLTHTHTQYMTPSYKPKFKACN